MVSTHHLFILLAYFPSACVRCSCSSEMHRQFTLLFLVRYVDETSIPASALEAERTILTEQALASGKKPEFVDKMVEGRLKKFYAEVSVFHYPEKMTASFLRVFPHHVTPPTSAVRKK